MKKLSLAVLLSLFAVNASALESEIDSVQVTPDQRVAAKQLDRSIEREVDEVIAEMRVQDEKEILVEADLEIEQEEAELEAQLAD
ncbi:hypothetical protein [Thalassotalea agarivorans]|uniref:Uncharacterized protein n=1 Tax=Thalassotalea agarivorans TaxID=349064 RepID=A0A1I0DLX2_THASX|nr:hypothetical protein [Thalassotalea agarivorans]SET33110.1 hypothetical protein SAMN05660429_01563 [Thalassotalea agarivorans]